MGILDALLNVLIVIGILDVVVGVFVVVGVLDVVVVVYVSVVFCCNHRCTCRCHQCT